METSTLDKCFESLSQELIQCFLQDQQGPNGDLITLRTLHVHLIGRLMRQWGLSWNYVVHLWKSHVYVHPENVRLLRNGDDELEAFLAQGFVKTDKLVRILRNLSQHDVDVDEILAIDGLSGNMTNGPNFEHKYYVHTLKYAREGPRSDFDEDPDYKRLHAQTVRRLYSLLEEHVEQPSRYVYNVLRDVLKPIVALPALTEKLETTLSPDVHRQCVKLYEASVPEEDRIKVVKNIRWKGEKRASEENESPPSKTQKTEKKEKR